MEILSGSIFMLNCGPICYEDLTIEQLREALNLMAHELQDRNKSIEKWHELTKDFSC